MDSLLSRWQFNSTIISTDGSEEKSSFMHFQVSESSLGVVFFTKHPDSTTEEFGGEI